MLAYFEDFGNTYTSVRTLTPRSAHASPRDVVHVTILAEAYTAAQENEFYADCTRLVDTRANSGLCEPRAAAGGARSARRLRGRQLAERVRSRW